MLKDFIKYAKILGLSPNEEVSFAFITKRYTSLIGVFDPKNNSEANTKRKMNALNKAYLFFSGNQESLRSLFKEYQLSKNAPSETEKETTTDTEVLIESLKANEKSFSENHDLVSSEVSLDQNTFKETAKEILTNNEVIEVVVASAKKANFAPKKRKSRLRKIVDPFVNLGLMFKKGSIFTKLSYLIFGFGLLARKQFIKGFLLLLVQVLLLAIFIINPKVNATPIGLMAILNFFTLGGFDGSDPSWLPNPITGNDDIFYQISSDNSLLMLLFGIVSIALLLIYILVWIKQIKLSFLNDQDIAKGVMPNSFKTDIKTLSGKNFSVLMLLLPILGVLVFTILPIIFMILIAFTDYSRYTVANGLFNWVGLRTFLEIFTIGSRSNAFLGVLVWTIVWAIGATFSNYYLGIMLAVLINKEGLKFKKFFRTIFILTIALPQFVTLLVMRLMLREEGPINNLLAQLGLNRIDFLGHTTNVWIPRMTVIFVNMWIGIPYTMLLTTGILMNVPKDLYEAAAVDGANKYQIFAKITLPYIFFITTPSLITSFMGNITSFNIIYLLTGGGGGPISNNIFLGTPAGSGASGTDLLVTWLYKLTIDHKDYNIGAVISIITFVILAIGTLITYTRSKSYKESEAFQ